eukprot:m.20535 g.20535  ORF g.20535 m.20535 type:complete len:630 (+) comp12982_c0_seq1:97-1986(+)
MASLETVEAAFSATAIEIKELQERLAAITLRTTALESSGKKDSGKEGKKEAVKPKAAPREPYPEFPDSPTWMKENTSMQHPFTMHDRVVLKNLLASGKASVGKTVVAGGWVKTGRKQGNDSFAFLEVTDGSAQIALQIVVTKEVYDLSKIVAAGTSILVKGEVKACEEGSKQEIELSATEVIYVGECDASTYPIPKTRQGIPLEKIRDIMRFRPRTNLHQAVFRIRNALATATHMFFQQNGFLYLHAPIITSSDCEGAGEMFQVSQLLQKADEEHQKEIPTDEELAAAQAKQAKSEERLAEFTEKKKKREIKKEETNLEAAQKELKYLTEKKAGNYDGGIYRADKKEIDYSKDFFKKPAHLTVSGQLDAEIYACSMTSVYTFGPTFRAEMSHTTRHLAEFWMIEPEIAFCDLEGDMKCAEQYVQFCCTHVLQTCREEMEFIADKVDNEAIARVAKVASKGFSRITYTDAIALLIKHVEEGKVKWTKENENVYWGLDMASEHEKYLAEKVFMGPVIVYNYPADIKAFYMRMTDGCEEGKQTVAAMDVLVPKVGELIGGSQREERFDHLLQRIKDMNLNQEDYEWYLDLRRYGTVPHSGFGLGFERLVLFTTGLENIRDVIPFPRAPGRIY